MYKVSFNAIYTVLCLSFLLERWQIAIAKPVKMLRFKYLLKIIIKTLA